MQKSNIEEFTTLKKVTPSLFLLEPGAAKDVLLSSKEELHDSSTVLSVFTGPELLRQVIRRVKQMPGATRMNDSPAMMGVNFLEERSPFSLS